MFPKDFLKKKVDILSFELTALVEFFYHIPPMKSCSGSKASLKSKFFSKRAEMFFIGLAFKEVPIYRVCYSFYSTSYRQK